MNKYYKTDLIENFRKENNLTVELFCRICQITKQAYYKIINQQLKCKIVNLFKVARVMKISISELHY